SPAPQKPESILVLEPTRERTHDHDHPQLPPQPLGTSRRALEGTRPRLWPPERPHALGPHARALPPLRRPLPARDRKARPPRHPHRRGRPRPAAAQAPAQTPEAPAGAGKVTRAPRP